MFFQAEDGIRGSVASRGLGDVYKRQIEDGVVLGRIVEESSDFSEIIERYEAARIERSHFVTEHSKKAGQRFTGNNPDAYTKEDHKNEEELGLFYYDPGNVIV